MMAPAWVLDVLAVVMLIVAAVSAARLAAARPWLAGRASGRVSGWVSSDTDVAHLLMAIAMAGMLATGLRTLPAGGWEVIFGVLTAWFGYRVVADLRGSGFRALSGRNCAPHAVHSAAMLYMFLALTGAGSGSRAGMSGVARSAMPALRYPALAFVLALILIGYSVWDLDQLSARRASPARASGAVTGRAPIAEPALSGVAVASYAGGPVAGGQVAVARSDPAGAGRARQVAGDPPGGRPVARRLLSPGVTVACRIAMGVTMAFLLLISL